MMYQLLLQTVKTRMAAIKITLAVVIVLSVLTSNVPLTDFLPTFSKTNTCGSSNEDGKSCGMACCVGKSDPSSCCQVKPYKAKRRKESASCHEDSFTNATYSTPVSELDLSLWVEYYKILQQENLEKLAASKLTGSKISTSVLTKPCPCDSKGVTTQLRIYSSLVIFANNSQTRPLTKDTTFDLYNPLITKTQNYQSLQQRAPPTSLPLI